MMRPVSAMALFALLAAGCLPAAAQDTTLGLGVGYVKPSDVDGTLWLTANVQFKVAENVVVEPEAGWWKKSASFPGIFDVSIEDFDAGANVLYRSPGEGVRFTVGAGVGAHFLKAKAGILGFSDSDTETKVGAHLLAGVEFGGAASVRFFVNGRYDLVSDLNQFKIYGGVRFKL